jgi:hypothetical protein
MTEQEVDPEVGDLRAISAIAASNSASLCTLDSGLRSRLFASSRIAGTLCSGRAPLPSLFSYLLRNGPTRCWDVC